MPERPSKLLPALYGGVIMGVISAVPFLNLLNCLCCAGIMVGGLMSVFFYKNDLTPSMPSLTSSDGLQLGALAGVFGAIVGTILHALTLAAFGGVGSETVMQILRSFGDQMPPQVLDQIESLMQHSGGFSGLSILWTFLTSIILDPLFGLLGGLIGYSLFKAKPEMVNVQPPPPPAQQ
jgi:hypothetical protein